MKPKEYRKLRRKLENSRKAYDALDQFCASLIEELTALKDAYNIIAEEAAAREQVYMRTIKHLRETLEGIDPDWSKPHSEKEPDDEETPVRH